MGNWLNSWLTGELYMYIWLILWYSISLLCLNCSPKGSVGLVTLKGFVTTIWMETTKLYRTYYFDNSYTIT